MQEKYDFQKDEYDQKIETVENAYMAKEDGLRRELEEDYDQKVENLHSNSIMKE